MMRVEHREVPKHGRGKIVSQAVVTSSCIFVNVLLTVSNTISLTAGERMKGYLT